MERSETLFSKLKRMPGNIWAVSLTSFFMDVSSEMVLNLLPLYLQGVLGAPAAIIGFIEGSAESIASLLKWIAGWVSDKIRSRKWLAVVGYGLSALAKPFFYFAHSWELVGAVRWTDRVGKGIRTAPRDALVADGVAPDLRGLAFGLHRASDTAGAMLGILIAALVVWQSGIASGGNLSGSIFQRIVLISIIPGLIAVLALAFGAKEVKPKASAKAWPKLTFKGLGKPFAVFMIINMIFDIGNSSDAFLILRAKERGMSIFHILLMLASFNLIYALVSTPAGAISDKIGRRRVIIGGWIIYALIYLGFALSKTQASIWILFAIYGLYYGLAYGTSKAMIADIVPYHMRATAYGTYEGILGIQNLPASLIAGLLWSGAFGWKGFGPSAPFFFGAACALLAVVLFIFWKPDTTGIETEAPAEAVVASK